MSEIRGWDEFSLAAGASCPVPGCGSLAISYSFIERVEEGTRMLSLDWEFSCPRCGMEFVPPKDKLIFQSVPRSWLLASISHA